MLKTIRRATAGAAALLALVAAAPAAAEPALWVVKDADSTLYLFGTVHVLKPGQDWRSPKVLKALTEAQELVLEVKLPDNPAEAQGLFLKYGMDPATPLSSKLKPEEWEKLKTVAAGIGLPEPALSAMRPWLAAMTLQLAPLAKAGYDPQSGVEIKLTADAKAASKPINALETVEQQVRFFADMPPEAELAMLRAAIEDVDEAVQQLDGMVTAWAAGEPQKLEDAFVDEFRREYPQLYKVALVQRNQDWAKQIEKKLAGSGVSFIAVGAGHLVGPDSVQAELAKKGIKAERF